MFVAAELRRDLRGPVLVDVVDPHERTGTHERAADLFADATSAAGDDRTASAEIDVETRHEPEVTPSDLDDDGDDWAGDASRSLMNLPERTARVAADRLEVRCAFPGGVRERLPHCGLGLLEEILGLGRVHPARG